MSPRPVKQIRLLCVLACACCTVPASSFAAAQPLSQAAENAKTITGKVVDSAGRPLPGVTVKLHTQTDMQSNTDASGSFSFHAAGNGPFQITAELRGKRASTLTVPQIPSTPITLVLAEASSAKSPGDDMGFSDAPNFTVAGVTDWTAVGGHGSDATLRTSEDLARTTAALHAMERTNGGDREAEQRLQKAVQAAPKSYAANLALGEYYLHTSNYTQAEKTLQVASTAGSGQPEVEYDLALACRGLRDIPSAKAHIARALKSADRADYHRLAGELDEASGDPFSAVRQMAQAAQLDPSEANYFTWGSELLLHRAILQAGQIFARGAALHPASARLRTGWGSALFSEARYEEAAQRLCEASDLQPNEPEPYLALGKADGASPVPLPGVLERLERFLKLQPRNPHASYLLATALLRRGDPATSERAQTLLQQTVILDPKYAEAYLELGKIAATKKNVTETIHLYQEAIQSDPELGEAHFRLAVLYERTGKPAEAKQERAQHEAIEQKRAEQTEQERRSVKQFLVVLQETPNLK
ncbi:Tfp pilus assembly protein PilF [Terriglobus roseus DSM 18391]|uniref:Tfp pilus assembly protein PilF n=1 Tax=Terriglobus roseus (strain DSM 18391 / NRRL B-41598 / KBS 63) TaxID=926566 RepID=I3ZIS7_TERRK|nr:tetratricopeptide repeat protein [Terriglobus roseus]AFL89145.1 Tfp pilus assembly protein PilF [Terriglobus roseus DSM 18391]